MRPASLSAHGDGFTVGAFIKQPPVALLWVIQVCRYHWCYFPFTSCPPLSFDLVYSCTISLVHWRLILSLIAPSLSLHTEFIPRFTFNKVHRFICCLFRHSVLTPNWSNWWFKMLFSSMLKGSSSNASSRFFLCSTYSVHYSVRGRPRRAPDSATSQLTRLKLFILFLYKYVITSIIKSVKDDQGYYRWRFLACIRLNVTFKYV